MTALGSVTWKRGDKSVRCSTFMPHWDFFVLVWVFFLSLPPFTSLTQTPSFTKFFYLDPDSQVLHQFLKDVRQTVNVYISKVRVLERKETRTTKQTNKQTPKS